jgi:hypothetical protein
MCDLTDHRIGAFLKGVKPIKIQRESARLKPCTSQIIPRIKENPWLNGLKRQKRRSAVEDHQIQIISLQGTHKVRRQRHSKVAALSGGKIRGEKRRDVHIARGRNPPFRLGSKEVGKQNRMSTENRTKTLFIHKKILPQNKEIRHSVSTRQRQWTECSACSLETPLRKPTDGPEDFKYIFQSTALSGKTISLSSRTTQASLAAAFIPSSVTLRLSIRKSSIQKIFGKLKSEPKLIDGNEPVIS